MSSPITNPLSTVWNVRVVVPPQPEDEHPWYTSARFHWVRPVSIAWVKVDPEVLAWVDGRTIDAVYPVEGDTAVQP